MSNCNICNAQVNSIYSFVIKKCDHTFCHQCSVRHIQKMVMEESKSKVNCPILKCSERIPDQIIRKCLSNAEIERYEELAISSAWSNSIKCFTKGCNIIYIIKDINSVFHCNYCDQPNCLRCMKQHFPNDCYRNNDNEVTFANAAAEIMKQKKREELESKFQNQGFIPNPEAFECSICGEFILPRTGLIMRNCLHCFCKNCLENTLNNKTNMAELKCPSCSVDINEGEVLRMIGVDNMMSMINRAAAPKFFCCKSPDCAGMWDPNNFRGQYKCPVCSNVNCLECEDIHEGETCEQFRTTKRYKDCEAAREKLRGRGVSCRCGRYLIHVGGCGAMRCDTCGRQVCLFTGKEAGNTGPNSCGCTASKPCDVKCKFGCFPE